jgi:hypothetical protein
MCIYTYKSFVSRPMHLVESPLKEPRASKPRRLSLYRIISLPYYDRAVSLLLHIYYSLRYTKGLRLLSRVGHVHTLPTPFKDDYDYKGEEHQQYHLFLLLSVVGLYTSGGLILQDISHCFFAGGLVLFIQSSRWGRKLLVVGLLGLSFSLFLCV